MTLASDPNAYANKYGAFIKKQLAKFPSKKPVEGQQAQGQPAKLPTPVKTGPPIPPSPHRPAEPFTPTPTTKPDFVPAILRSPANEGPKATVAKATKAISAKAGGFIPPRLAIMPRTLEGVTDLFTEAGQEISEGIAKPGFQERFLYNLKQDFTDKIRQFVDSVPGRLLLGPYSYVLGGTPENEGQRVYESGGPEAARTYYIQSLEDWRPLAQISAPMGTLIDLLQDVTSTLPDWIFGATNNPGFASGLAGMQAGVWISKVPERMAYLASQVIDVEPKAHLTRDFIREQGRLPTRNEMEVASAEWSATHQTRKENFEDFVTNEDGSLNWERLLGKFSNPFSTDLEQSALGLAGLTGLGWTFAFHPEREQQFIDSVNADPDRPLWKHVRDHEDIWAEMLMNTITDPMWLLPLAKAGTAFAQMSRSQQAGRVVSRVVFPPGFVIEPAASFLLTKVWARSPVAQFTAAIAKRSRVTHFSDDLDDLAKFIAIHYDPTIHGEVYTNQAGKTSLLQQAILDPDNFLPGLLSDRHRKVLQVAAEYAGEMDLTNVTKLLERYGEFATQPKGAAFRWLQTLGNEDVLQAFQALSRAVTHVYAEELGVTLYPRGAIRRAISWAQAVLIENWLWPNIKYHTVNTVGDTGRMITAGYLPDPFHLNKADTVSRYLGEEYGSVLPTQIAEMMLHDALDDGGARLATAEIPWPIGDARSIKKLYELAMNKTIPEGLSNFLSGSSPFAWIIRNLNYSTLLRGGLTFGRLSETSRRATVFIQEFQTLVEGLGGVRGQMVQAMPTDPNLPPGLLSRMKSGQIKQPKDFDVVTQMVEGRAMPAESIAFDRPATVPDNDFTEQMAAKLDELQARFLGNLDNPLFLRRGNALFQRATVAMEQKADQAIRAVESVTILPDEWLARYKKADEILEKTGGTEVFTMEGVPGELHYGESLVQLLAENPENIGVVIYKGTAYGGDQMHVTSNVLLAEFTGDDASLVDRAAFSFRRTDNPALFPSTKMMIEGMEGELDPVQFLRDQKQAAQGLLDAGFDPNLRVAHHDPHTDGVEHSTLGALADLQGVLDGPLDLTAQMPPDLRAQLKELELNLPPEEFSSSGIFDPAYAKKQLDMALRGEQPENVVFGAPFDGLEREETINLAQTYVDHPDGPMAGLRMMYQDSLAAYYLQTGSLIGEAAPITQAPSVSIDDFLDEEGEVIREANLAEYAQLSVGEQMSYIEMVGPPPTNVVSGVPEVRQGLGDLGAYYEAVLRDVEQGLGNSTFFVSVGPGGTFVGNEPGLVASSARGVGLPERGAISPQTQLEPLEELTAFISKGEVRVFTENVNEAEDLLRELEAAGLPEGLELVFRPQLGAPAEGTPFEPVASRLTPADALRIQKIVQDAGGEALTPLGTMQEVMGLVEHFKDVLVDAGILKSGQTIKVLNRALIAKRVTLEEAIFLADEYGAGITEAELDSFLLTGGVEAPAPVKQDWKIRNMSADPGKNVGWRMDRADMIAQMQGDKPELGNTVGSWVKDELYWSKTAPSHGPLKREAGLTGPEAVGTTIDFFVQEDGRIVAAVPSSYEDALAFARELLDLGVHEKAVVQFRWTGIETPYDEPVSDVLLGDFAKERYETDVDTQIFDQALADYRHMMQSRIRDELARLRTGMTDWQQSFDEIAGRNAKVVQADRERIEAMTTSVASWKQEWINKIDDASVKASAEVQQVLFDYVTKLTPERTLRTYTPFSTWQLRNPIFWAQAFSAKPGLVGFVYRAVRALESDRKRKNLTERFQGTVGANLPQTGPFPAGYYALDTASLIDVFGQFQQPFESPLEEAPPTGWQGILRNMVDMGRWTGIRPWPYIDLALQELGVTPKEGVGEVFGPAQRFWEAYLRETGGLPPGGRTPTGQWIFQYLTRRRIAEMEAEGLLTHAQALASMSHEAGQPWEDATDFVLKQQNLLMIISFLQPFGIKYASEGELAIREALRDIPAGRDREEFPFLETYSLALGNNATRNKAAVIYNSYEEQLEGLSPASLQYKNLISARTGELAEIDALATRGGFDLRTVKEYEARQMYSGDLDAPAVLRELADIQPSVEQWSDDRGKVNWDGYWEMVDDFNAMIPELSDILGESITSDDWFAYKDRYKTAVQVAYNFHRDVVNDYWDQWETVQPGGSNFERVASEYINKKYQEALEAGFTPEDAAAYVVDLQRSVLARGLPYDVEVEFMGPAVNAVNAQTYSIQTAERLGLIWQGVATELAQFEFPGMFGTADAEDQMLNYYFELTPPEQRQIASAAGKPVEEGFTSWWRGLDSDQQAQLWQNVSNRQGQRVSLADETRHILKGDLGEWILPPGDLMTDKERSDLAQVERDWFIYSLHQAGETSTPGPWTPLMEKFYGDETSGQSRFWDTLNKYVLTRVATEDPIIGAAMDRISRGTFDFTDEQWNEVVDYFLENLEMFVDEERTQALWDNPELVNTASVERTDVLAQRNRDMEDIKARYFNIYWEAREEWEKQNPTEWAGLESYLAYQNAYELGQPYYLYVYKNWEYVKWFGNSLPSVIENKAKLLSQQQLQVQQDYDLWLKGGPWTTLMDAFIGVDPNRIQIQSSSAPEPGSAPAPSPTEAPRQPTNPQPPPPSAPTPEPPPDMPPPPPPSPSIEGQGPGPEGQGLEAQPGESLPEFQRRVYGRFGDIVQGTLSTRIMNEPPTISVAEALDNAPGLKPWVREAFEDSVAVGPMEFFSGFAQATEKVVQIGHRFSKQVTPTWIHINEGIQKAEWAFRVTILHEIAHQADTIGAGRRLSESASFKLAVDEVLAQDPGEWEPVYSLTGEVVQIAPGIGDNPMAPLPDGGEWGGYLELYAQIFGYAEGDLNKIVPELRPFYDHLIEDLGVQQ